MKINDLYAAGYMDLHIAILFTGSSPFFFGALYTYKLLVFQVSSWFEIILGSLKLLTLQRCQPFGGVSASQVNQKPDVEQLAS